MYFFGDVTYRRGLTFITIICYCIQIIGANQELCDEENSVVRDPDNCSKYFLCKDGSKHHLECENDQKFDSETGKCSTIDESQCRSREAKYFSQSDESPKAGDTDLLTTPQTSSYKVFCYYTSYSFSYKGKSKFLPGDIDPSLCSHIMYFRAIIDNSTLEVTSFNPWVDFDNGGYKKVVAMKARGPKVLLVIGGWSESNDDKFSRITGSESLRETVIQNIVSYLEKYGFDGVEIDWEFPTCWQDSCSKGLRADGTNFLIFIKQLNEALKRKNLLLSTVASRSAYIVDKSYNIKAVSEHVDWIMVQTMNYNGVSQGITGHVAPLYGEDNLNVNFSIQHVLAKGVDPSKIVMAIPAFTNHFELADEENTGYNSLIEKGGPNGEFLNETDILGFVEICYYVKNYNWTVVRDPAGKTGPYAFKDSLWASFDDMTEAKRKCDYIKKYKLGGIYFWNLSYEDIRNRCGCGKYPILSTISHELRGTAKPNNLENCVQL